MDKTIIISDYDMMYWFAIYVKGKTYYRRDIRENNNIPQIVMDILGIYDPIQYGNGEFGDFHKDIKKLMKENDISTTIVCADGGIEIIELEE